MASLLERHADLIVGVLGCYDRVILQGFLPGVGHAKGMTGFLKAKGVRVFDFPKFVEPVTEAIRENAQRVAKENGLEIDFIRRAKDFRKEDRIAEILARRGTHPGLVHIFSAMETCRTFKPWHDKNTHRTFLRPDTGKCLHYYFYFIDPEFGLCFLRVPTWAPFRVQFYFNGHNWLAKQLEKRAIGFEIRDNAFVHIHDFGAAQKIADRFDVEPLHRALDRAAERYCPAVRAFDRNYYWSPIQVEYATDAVFKNEAALHGLYAALVRTAIHAVHADNVSRFFLDKKLHGGYRGEVVTDFRTRAGMTCVRHRMGPASVKMYDKFGRVLRIETTTYDVSFFKHHREVHQKDGQVRFKLAPLRKTIYSLNPDLRQLLSAANQRYLAFISTLDDPSAGAKSLPKITQPVRDNGRPYRGFNLFAGPDLLIFQALARGEFNITGFRNRDLRDQIPAATTAQISRCLKRLRLHGLVKLVGGTFKYYLTELGRKLVIAALTLIRMILVPQLARPGN